MKFLTDENIAVSVVKFLRQRDHIVKNVKEESMYSYSDKDILELAIKEKRVILTHDKDFMEIVKNYSSDFEGIILIRCKNQNPENVSEVLDNLLNIPMIKKIKNSLFILNEKQLIIVKNK